MSLTTEELLARLKKDNRLQFKKVEGFHVNKSDIYTLGNLKGFRVNGVTADFRLGLNDKWEIIGDVKLEVGSIVKFTSQKKHDELPAYYPIVGTIGVVTTLTKDSTIMVRWEKGTTSREDTFWVDINNIEVVDLGNGRVK